MDVIVIQTFPSSILVFLTFCHFVELFCVFINPSQHMKDLRICIIIHVTYLYLLFMHWLLFLDIIIIFWYHTYWIVRYFHTFFSCLEYIKVMNFWMVTAYNLQGTQWIVKIIWETRISIIFHFQLQNWFLMAARGPWNCLFSRLHLLFSYLF